MQEQRENLFRSTKNANFAAGNFQSLSPFLKNESETVAFY